MAVSPEDQARLLAAVKTAQAEAEEATARARATRQRAVVAALDSGITAVQIAESLGVTRARVYQMRDGK